MSSCPENSYTINKQTPICVNGLEFVREQKIETTIDLDTNTTTSKILSEVFKDSNEVVVPKPVNYKLGRCDDVNTISPNNQYPSPIVRVANVITVSNVSNQSTPNNLKSVNFYVKTGTATILGTVFSTGDSTGFTAPNNDTLAPINYSVPSGSTLNIFTLV